MLICACDVYGTLCIDWLRGSIRGGKPISSMDGYREGYLKRERESRCRLLLMSSWPDDGALVMKWKKGNEVRRTKLSLMILHPERSKKCVFKISVFSLFEHEVEILRIMDIAYTRYCCLSAI